MPARLNLTTLAVYTAGLVAVYIWLRGAKGAASDVAELVVKSAEGAIIGVGKAVGIPETDAQQCEQYVNAGDWWNASFFCPAGTFLKSATGAVIDTVSGAVVGYVDAGNTQVITIDYSDAQP